MNEQEGGNEIDPNVNGWQEMFEGKPREYPQKITIKEMIENMPVFPSGYNKSDFVMPTIDEINELRQYALDAAKRIEVIRGQMIELKAKADALDRIQDIGFKFQTERLFKGQ